MKDFNNIEELFKENLSGFEADPGAGVWESISQSLPAQGAAGTTVTGAAAKFTALKWIAGVTLLTGGIGLGTMYFMNAEEEKTDNPAQKKEEVADKSITVDNRTVEEKEENIVSDEIKNSSVATQEVVIIKDKEKNKTIVVTAKENPKFKMNKSSVDSWITRRNNYTVNSTSQNNGEEIAVITSDNKTESPVTYEVKEVDESKPIAAITRSIAGGPAPLTVTFSNATEEKAYEWNIGGYTISEESYTHVFEVPGTYKVKLTVKNAKGIKATDEVEVVVGEPIKKEEALKSKITTGGVNVFSPNNDGVNDWFYMNFEYENIESFILQISNLKGEVIFETNDPDFKWDGTMRNGEIVPEGKYMYTYFAIGKDKVKHPGSKSFAVTK